MTTILIIYTVIGFMYAYFMLGMIADSKPESKEEREVIGMMNAGGLKGGLLNFLTAGALIVGWLPITLYVLRMPDEPTFS